MSENNDNDRCGKYREHLMNTDFEMAKTFEKYLLTLSCSALLLSISFIKDIVNEPLLNTFFYLRGGGLVLLFVS